MTTIPALSASLSLYRGQSRTGIGEGPGNPVAHGEQYLAADSPLGGDGALLAEVRPWLSLDIDPDDAQRLGERLEGWSCVARQGRLFVVRLCAAGTYGPRPAYFAHGRAWALSGLPAGCDPGLLVGRAEAFAAPWRDGERPAPFPAPEPAVQSAPIAREPDAAARFLAHLFQALAGGYPAIVAVPAVDLATGSPLHALLAFARAALPADRRDACTVRINTHLPDVFLRQGASLVGVPEPAAGAALRARRDAVLLDRQGEVRAGPPVAAAALRYAEAVVERTLSLPAGLVWFAERYPRHRSVPGQPGLPGLPNDIDLHTLRITFNLAFTLAAPGERGGDFVRHYLPGAAKSLGPGVVWERLLDAEEWRRLPVAAWRGLVLRCAASPSPGERHLAAATAAALGGMGVALDDDLDGWWETAGSSRLAALLEILAFSPRLVSPRRAAEMTARVTVDEMAAAGSPHSALDAELAAGVLARREGESGALARAARHPRYGPRVFAVLAGATAAGALAPDWAASYVRAAAREERVAVAARLFQQPHFWERWGAVPNLVLDGLRELGEIPPALRPALAAAAGRLDPIARLDVFIRLADLLAAADRAAAGPLLARLRQELRRLADPEARRYLVRFALDDAWSCLGLSFLVEPGGELALPWVEGVADLLLAAPPVVAALATPALLRLAAAAETEGARRAGLDEIDRRAEDRLEETTAALLRQGWWHTWSGQRRDDPSGAAGRRRALAFLASAVWHRDDAPDAPREAWLWAVNDLRATGGLAGREVLALRGAAAGERPWPWMPAFRREQIEELAALATDLGALAEMAAAVQPAGRDEDLGEAVPELLLRHADPRLSADLPESALRWLLAPPPSGPALVLAASKRLWELAGHLHQRAVLARVRSVAAHLAVNPSEALDAAADPDLWHDDGFLTALGAWMAAQSPAGVERAIWEAIEARVAAAPGRELRTAPLGVAQGLLDLGYGSAAEFLLPGVRARAGREKQVRALLEALAAGRGADACWDDLRAAIVERRGAGGRRHPLSVVAEQIRRGPAPAAAERAALAAKGWPAFAAAAERDPVLLAETPYESTLPALALAASFTAGGSLGGIAVAIASAAGSRSHRLRAAWWQALVRGLRDCRRQGSLRSAADREDVALALLARFGGTLEGAERWAFSQALRERQDELAGTRSDKAMNRTVTFFRPGQDESATYDVALRTPQELLSLVIYARQPLAAAALQDREVQDKSGSDQALKDLRMQISSHGGGGLLLTVAESNAGTAVKVEPVRGGGYRPPGRLWVLQTARPPFAREIGGTQSHQSHQSHQGNQSKESKAIELADGAHLLVPVDEDAEKHLQRFIQDLEWISPDLQALVLGAIRQPSLEGRLAKLEAAAAGGQRTWRPNEVADRQAPAATAGMGGALAWLRRAWARRAPLASMLTLLLLAALTANALRMQTLLGRLGMPGTPEPATRDVAPAGAQPLRQAPAGGTAMVPGSPALDHEDLAADLRSLFDALRARRGASRALDRLYDASFKAYEKASIQGGDPARLFAKSNRPLLWGLIKLQILKLRPDADPGFLQSDENSSGTKKALRRIPLQALASDPAGRDLLLVAACHLGDAASPAPALPALPAIPALPASGTNGADPPYVILRGADCAAYQPARAGAGIRALAAFVEAFEELRP